MQTPVKRQSPASVNQFLALLLLNFLFSLNSLHLPLISAKLEQEREKQTWLFQWRAWIRSATELRRWGRLFKRAKPLLITLYPFLGPLTAAFPLLRPLCVRLRCPSAPSSFFAKITFCLVLMKLIATIGIWVFWCFKGNPDGPFKIESTFLFWFSNVKTQIFCFEAFSLVFRVCLIRTGSGHYCLAIVIFYIVSRFCCLISWNLEENWRNLIFSIKVSPRIKEYCIEWINRLLFPDLSRRPIPYG